MLPVATSILVSSNSFMLIASSPTCQCQGPCPNRWFSTRHRWNHCSLQWSHVSQENGLLICRRSSTMDSLVCQSVPVCPIHDLLSCPPTYIPSHLHAWYCQDQDQVFSLSRSSNPILSDTWISADSLMAGTTLSSYQDFANDRHSKIHVNFHFTNYTCILTNFQVTCWGYPKLLVSSTVIITNHTHSTPFVISNTCMISIHGGG